VASITLSDEARQILALFEDVTEATARDCVIDEDYGRVIVLVAPGQMGKAIGPGGQAVQKVQRKLSREVKLVEGGDTAERLVTNALAPAVVYNVTVSEGGEDDDTIAYAEVAEDDTGAAIGKNGQNIDAARLLAKRHFDVDEIELV
jgi:N utilization substance protein A